MKRATVAVLALAAATLTGCSPAERGIAGMTLDARGRPVAVAAWCPGKPPDSFVIYASADSDVKITLRAPAKFSGTSIAVPLDRLPAGWTSDPAAPVLDPAVEYSVYAPVEGSDHTTRSARFTLARLRQGQIIDQGYDQKNDKAYDIYRTQAEFERVGNRDYC